MDTDIITKIDVFPATAERWADLEGLFGERGAYAGCWCMFWRLDRADFKQLGGPERKEILRSKTASGEPPGLLAYSGGQVVAWCAIGPREHYLALEKSRILKRIDDQPVWVIPCFFVGKPYRRHGLMRLLVEAAVKYAWQQGAHIVEAYPIDMGTPQLSGQNLTSYAGYMGIASAFREAGFEEVGRASQTQLIMRCYRSPEGK